MQMTLDVRAGRAKSTSAFSSIFRVLFFGYQCRMKFEKPSAKKVCVAVDLAYKKTTDE